MRAEPRYTFSINLPISLYQRVLNEAGKGKISNFIKEILEEKFVEKESCLGNAYKECYTNNPHLLKLAKQWEKAEIESWLNYEKNNVKKRGKK